VTAVEPRLTIYVRDENASSDGEKYGCMVAYQGSEPIDRSISEWDHLFSLDNSLEVVPKIRESLASFKKLGSTNPKRVTGPSKSHKESRQQTSKTKVGRKKDEEDKQLTATINQLILSSEPFEDEQGEIGFVVLEGD